MEESGKFKNGQKLNVLFCLFQVDGANGRCLSRIDVQWTKGIDDYDKYIFILFIKFLISSFSLFYLYSIYSVFFFVFILSMNFSPCHRWYFKLATTKMAQDPMDEPIPTWLGSVDTILLR